MKLEEVKIGIRVVMCRKMMKHHYSNEAISSIEKHYFPGIVVGFSQAFPGEIQVQSLAYEYIGIFRPGILVPD